MLTAEEADQEKRSTGGNAPTGGSASEDASPALRVLYMEDDPVTARIVQAKLEKKGFEVSLASDGGEGLKRLDKESFDIVLVDKNMPVHDGLEVIRIVCRSADETTVSPIMITASGDEKAAVEAMKLGAADYLVKDPDGQFLALLPTVIEQALAKRELAVAKRRAEEERERLIVELQEALAEVKALSGLLPICTSCKKIRDDEGYWKQIERYIQERSEAQFSHGICPECAAKLYPDYYPADPD
jgi:PleD family two-component response regulator